MNFEKKYIVDNAGRPREKSDLDLPQLNAEIIGEQNKIVQKLSKLLMENDEEFKNLSKLEVAKVISSLGYKGDYQGKKGLIENFDKRIYSPKEFIFEHKDLLRKFVYCYENIIAPKAKIVGTLSEQREAAYSYLTEIEAHLLKPRNEDEKIDGYNFILESFIIQKIKEKLNESVIADWQIKAATGEQDFFAGTDFLLTFNDPKQENKINKFVIGIDLGLGASFKAYWKKMNKTDLPPRQKSISEADFLIAYNPIIDGIESKMEDKTYNTNIDKQKEWYKLAEQIMEQISVTKDLINVEMPMSVDEQMQIIINKALAALDSTVTGTITNASAEIIKLQLNKLKNRLEFNKTNKNN